VQVLVVAGDRALADVLRRGLREEQPTVDVQHDGQVGLERTLSHSDDALILDERLPHRDGEDVVRDLRASGTSIPVLLLATGASLVCHLQNRGVDAYLDKPFSGEDAGQPEPHDARLQRLCGGRAPRGG
jgi:DNA-binding response OmpR family regulator